MPVVETTPAAGGQVVASAQVLNRRILIIKGDPAVPSMGFFGPADLGTADGGFRTETITVVNNLPEITFNVFLYPFYDDGVTEYRARNFLEWRPVFRMPPDGLGTNVTNQYRGLATDDWIPFCSPMLLPIGVPVVYKASGFGVKEVAIEVRVPLAPEAPIEATDDQGQDRVVLSITASQ